MSQVALQDCKGLIVLTKIIQHFPVIQNLAIDYFHFQVCEDEKEQRQDMYIWQDQDAKFYIFSTKFKHLSNQ